MADNSVTHLECSLCSKKFAAGKAWNVCECGGPLLVRYDLDRLRAEWSIDSLASAPNNLWRYAPALPIRHETLHRLTALFEKARYSFEEVDPEEAVEAESVLSELKSEVVGEK